MSSLPSLADALIVFIMLVPGFIAFWIVRQLGAVAKKLSEFETTIWSFIFTAIILLGFTTITQLYTLDLIRDNFFYPLNYGILFGLTGIVGVIVGGIFRRFRRYYQAGDPWSIAMKHYAPSGSWIKVITKTGEEYTGKYRYGGVEDDAKEVMMTSPKRIIRNADGTIADTFPFGEEILFTEDDVARVVFFEKWENDDAAQSPS